MPQKPIIPGQPGQPVIGSRFDVEIHDVDGSVCVRLFNVPGNKVLSCIDILQPGQMLNVSLTPVDTE